MTVSKTSRRAGEESAGTSTSRGWRRGSATPGGQLVDRVREALGFAHYDRMRRAMEPTLLIPLWPDLNERTREAYRTRMEYAVTPLLNLIDEERRDAADERDQQLADEGI